MFSLKIILVSLKLLPLQVQYQPVCFFARFETLGKKIFNTAFLVYMMYFAGS